MRKLIFFLIFLISLLACEKDSVETYSNLMTLNVENDNATADNMAEIKVTAEFPSNFTTEKDQKVDFVISKDPEVIVQSDIVLVSENGIKKKIAVVYVKHDKASKIKVKAMITANETIIVKEIEIVFKQPSPIDLMILKVENDNALGDNKDKVRVIAEFPIDFSNEEDQKVDFLIGKDTEVTLKGDILIVNDNGTKKRIAEAFVTNNKAGKIKVKALISVNGVKGYKETEISFKQPNIDSKMELKVENDNAFADSFDKIKITAEFPSDFLTEEGQKVDFIINKDIPETFKSDIILINDNGILKKIATVFVTHNKVSNLQVNAIITASGVQTSKLIQISYKQAYANAIAINSSSLKVKPNSFEIVTLTSKITRNKGIVTFATPVTTKAYDSNNNEIGIFIDYKDKTDVNGYVINNFTLGNSNYIGPIKVITKTVDADNNSINSEITLFSNN